MPLRGRIMLMEARAVEFTKLDMKIPSMIVYKEMKTIEMMAGATNLRNCPKLNFCENTFVIYDTSVI